MSKKNLMPLAVILACTAAACAPASPVFDQQFGGSARTLKAQQVRNPNAPVANRDKLPDGIDGRAAREGIERYQSSFGKPPPSNNTFTIGVSGAGRSGNSESAP